MKKHDGFFKRKKKGDEAKGPSGPPDNGWSDEEEEIIDLDDIIDDGEKLDDDALVASKLGLDVNLEEIDLDEDLFSKEFDAEQNALLDAVDLDDGDEILSDDESLDSEFRALLGEESAESGKGLSAAAKMETAPEKEAAGLTETGAESEPPELETVPDKPAQASIAEHVAEPVQEKELLGDDVDLTSMLRDLGQAESVEQAQEADEMEVTVEEPGALEEPPTIAAREEKESAAENISEPAAEVAVEAEPVLDESHLEQLVDQLEDRLQQVIMRAVAEQLPDIVREVLREQIERLKEELTA